MKEEKQRTKKRNKDPAAQRGQTSRYTRGMPSSSIPHHTRGRLVQPRGGSNARSLAFCQSKSKSDRDAVVPFFCFNLVFRMQGACPHTRVCLSLQQQTSCHPALSCTAPVCIAVALSRREGDTRQRSYATTRLYVVLVPR